MNPHLTKLLACTAPTRSLAIGAGFLFAQAMEVSETWARVTLCGLGLLALAAHELLEVFVVKPTARKGREGHDAH